LDNSSFVEIASLDSELRPASQVRARKDEDAVDAYAEAIDDMPAVTVYVDRTGTRWLADGYHTVSAATKAGRTEVKAKVINGEYLESFGFACKANRKHGIRPSAADKRRRVESALLIPEVAGSSNRAVAALCEVSESFVRNVRSESGAHETHVEAVDVPMARESIEPQVRVGRDGKVYPATRKDAAHRMPTPLVVGKGQDVPKPVEPVAAVVESAPLVVGQSRVNGVLGADPPDIAALRAAGKIPPNTIVEITETEGGHTFEDIKADVEARKAQEDEVPDADWLAALPLSSQLKDVPLKTFQSEALAYRHCVKYARNFGKMVAQEFNTPRQ
jgi:hypothetical protein